MVGGVDDVSPWWREAFGVWRGGVGWEGGGEGCLARWESVRVDARLFLHFCSFHFISFLFLKSSAWNIYNMQNQDMQHSIVTNISLEAADERESTTYPLNETH